MQRVSIALLAVALGPCSGLLVGAGTTPASAPRACLSMQIDKSDGAGWKTANVPRGTVSFNLFQNLQQVSDQRVAGLSHINLAPGKCTLPLPEAIALMKTWKEEIGDNEDKFGARARSDSHCPSAAKGGFLGFVVRKNLCEQFDEVLYKEKPGRVYGPVTTNAGLHLIYLHSCREPGSRGEAMLGLPFSFGGDKKD